MTRQWITPSAARRSLWCVLAYLFSGMGSAYGSNVTQSLLAELAVGPEVLSVSGLDVQRLDAFLTEMAAQASLLQDLSQARADWLLAVESRNLLAARLLDDPHFEDVSTALHDAGLGVASAHSRYQASVSALRRTVAVESMGSSDSQAFLRVFRASVCRLPVEYRVLDWNDEQLTALQDAVDRYAGTNEYVAGNDPAIRAAEQSAEVQLARLRISATANALAIRIAELPTASE